MLIRCVTTSLSEQQLAAMGNFYRAQQFFVSVGKSYLVLGLSFYPHSILYGQAALAEIEDDFGRLASVPLALFEVVDARVSVYWTVRVWEDSAVTLWPKPFYQRFFRDDLSEDTSEAVQQFKRVCKDIQDEAAAGEIIMGEDQ